jgi:hypothetical protein
MPRPQSQVLSRTQSWPVSDAVRDQRLLVGYLSYTREGGRCWAALVVMNVEGDPVEFAYTESLTIPSLQRHLFGERLDAYLLSSVLVPPLLDRLQRRPAFLCCDEPALLQRPLPGDLPALVFASAEARHDGCSWIPRPEAAGAESQPCWISRRTAASWPAVLDEAAVAMAPFGLREPFRQLRAAMADLRREGGPR